MNFEHSYEYLIDIDGMLPIFEVWEKLLPHSCMKL